MAYFDTTADPNDQNSSDLARLLTYGADTDEDRAHQQNAAPIIKSEAAAPNVPAAQTAQQLQAPTYTPPDRAGRAALTAKLTADSAPITNASPRWWERLAGGAAAGAMAFGHMPGAVEVGSNVTNRRYNAAYNVQQGKIAQDSAGLRAWDDNAQGQREDFQGQMQSFNAGIAGQRNAQLNDERAARQKDIEAQEQQRRQAIAPGTEAPDDPKNPMGTWHATRIDGTTIRMPQPPDSWLKTPAGQRQQRETDISSWGLKGEDAKYYRVNGKLKEPAAQTNIHIPSADSQEWETYKAGLGHKATPEDVINFRRGQPASAKPAVGTPQQMSKLVKERAEKFDSIDQQYNALKAGLKDPAEMKKIDAQREADKQQANAEFSDRFSALDPTGARAGGGGQQQTAQQPATAAPAPGRPTSQPPLPPVEKFKEGQPIYGRNGEKFVRRGNKWQPAPA